MLRQIYRGLVKYNEKTGAPENDLAESITSGLADLYTHVLPSLRKEAINLMDSILTGTK